MTTFILLAAAALYAGLAYPLVRRRIPPNHVYGIRTAATYLDETVWYDANAAGGRDMTVLAVVFAVCGLTLPNTDWGLGMAVALLLAGTVAMAWMGTSRARRMLAEREASAADGAAEAGEADEDEADETRMVRRRRRTR